MTKPSTRYSWQPLRSINAQEERLAQEQLTTAEAEFRVAVARFDRAQAVAAQWHERGTQTVRQLTKSHGETICPAAELQSVAAYNHRCFAMREKYRLRIRVAQEQAKSIADQIETLREALRTAHAKRSATDQHYNRWAQQARRSSELSAELEQEDQYLAQKNLRANSPLKS
jgi:hypothetical protein